MNHSGDAAEQIVRISLECVEVAAKITGNAAKEIALLLFAALKSNNSKEKSLKLRGKTRLASMLKSGKALEIFSVRESELKKFAQGAKQYGIVYCVLKNTKGSPDGLCDIMVRADDAPKVSRLIERYGLATVERASVEREDEPEILETPEQETENAPTTEAEELFTDAEDMEPPEQNDIEQLLDELLGTDDGRDEPESLDMPEEILEREPLSVSPDTPAVTKSPPDPYSAKTTEPRQSAPISGSRSKSERGTSTKPSVKEELREITAAKKKKEADAPLPDERASEDTPKPPPITKHNQPPRGGKSKSKKKGAR